MTRQEIEAALTMMGAVARERGRIVEIAIYGGSCIVLSSNLRAATRDVDAVFLSGAAEAYAIADETARRLGLSVDWINQGVKRYVAPPGNPAPTLFPLGDYPRGEPVGLRCFVPPPEYLLAMKLMADRDDPVDAARDLDDIVGLMSITGLTTPAQLKGLFATWFPGLNAFAAVALRIDTRSAQAADALADRPEVGAAWHARRGGPATP